MTIYLFPEEIIVDRIIKIKTLSSNKYIYLQTIYNFSYTSSSCPIYMIKYNYLQR